MATKKKGKAKKAAPRESPTARADKQLRKLEQDYHAGGRYIHAIRQKLVDLRQRWDQGERSKELFQEIASVTLPSN